MCGSWLVIGTELSLLLSHIAARAHNLIPPSARWREEELVLVVVVVVGVSWGRGWGGLCEDRDK